LKTILMSILAVGLIGGLVGGALFAHFTDTETSQDNTFQAGSIDLAVDDGSGVQNPWNTVEIYVEGKPCQWLRLEADELHNVGMNDGLLFVKFADTVWDGGSPWEPELELDPNNECDLQPYLSVIVIHCTDFDYLPIVEGAQTVQEAIDKIRDYDNAHGTTLLENVEYAGLFSGMDDDWKPLGSLAAGTSHDFQILIHLEQPADANKMMGDKVTFTKKFRLDQMPCGDQPGGGGKDLDLPTDPVSMRIDKLPGSEGDGGRCYFDIEIDVDETLPGYKPDSEVQDGVYTGWCLDDDHRVTTGWYTGVTLMSSLNPAIYGYDPDWASPMFNYVNYLINTYEGSVKRISPPDGTVAANDLQWAIWYFVNGTSYSDLPLNVNDFNARDLVDDALANGASYIPEEGDWCMVICYKSNKVQLIGIEVDP